MNLDALKAKGIDVFMEGDALRFSGPEGSREIVTKVMRDRVHRMLRRAEWRRPQYRDALALSQFATKAPYGSCELCAAELKSNFSGTCIFCAEVVRRALKLDDDARLVAIDTETTGRDPNRNGVIEVAAMVMDRTASVFIGSYEAKMPIRPEFLVDTRALEVNGYTPERWADAVSHAEAYAKLAELIRPHDVVIGWNVAFDANMLQGTAQILGLPQLPLIRCVDAYRTLERVLRGKTANMKLPTVTAYLGIEHAGAHTAMGDVDPLVKVWKWFLQQGGV